MKSKRKTYADGVRDALGLVDDTFRYKIYLSADALAQTISELMGKIKELIVRGAK